MPGGKQGDQEEVVITGDALIKRCPQQVQRRGDVVEPDYGGRMQVWLSPVKKNTAPLADSPRRMQAPNQG